MKRKLCLGIILAIFISGCNTAPKRTNNPKYVDELRGYIKTDKKEYNVGEEIAVSYMLRNITSKLHQEPITDGSKNPEEAFRSYSFNAQSKSNNLDHLEIKDIGKPLSGAISLKPNVEKVFVKNTFIASKEGSFILSFVLDWKNKKEILFKPLSVTIINPNAPKEETNDKPTGIDPKLQQLVSNLTSEDPEMKAQTKEQILEYGDKGLTAVVSAMGDDNPSLRSEAMLFLIEVGNESVPLLLLGAQHEKAEIRMRSIHSLGEIDPSEAIQVFKDALVNDPDKDVRLTAFRVVQIYADAIAVQLTVLALDDKSLEMRKEVIKALRTRTDQNFEYDPEAEKKERKPAITKWRQWASQKYRGK